MFETVKQMDNALQRRAKAMNSSTSSSSTSTNNVLTDSEKVFLQMKLDVEAFGQEMKTLFLSLPHDSLDGWEMLCNEVMEQCKFDQQKTK